MIDARPIATPRSYAAAVRSLLGPRPAVIPLAAETALLVTNARFSGTGVELVSASPSLAVGTAVVAAALFTSTRGVSRKLAIAGGALLAGGAAALYADAAIAHLVNYGLAVGTGLWAVAEHWRVEGLSGASAARPGDTRP